jgi:hypothetical protein
MFEIQEIFTNESCFYSYDNCVVSQARLTNNKLKIRFKKFKNLPIGELRNKLELPTKCVFNSHIIVGKLFPKNRFIDIENAIIRSEIIDFYNFLIDNQKLISDGFRGDNDVVKSLFLLIAGLSDIQIKKLCLTYRNYEKSKKSSKSIAW